MDAQLSRELGRYFKGIDKDAVVADVESIPVAKLKAALQETLSRNRLIENRMDIARARLITARIMLEEKEAQQ